MRQPSRPRAASPNRLRIIGGKWRSRILRFPSLEGLRPTPDRVRETLFNWLGQDLTGSRCLDLFAGSGALGFEALSRGASAVVMIEHSRAAAEALRANAALLGADAARIVTTDALHFVADADAGRFDVIFVDPPYGSALAARVLPRLGDRLQTHGVVYVESAATIVPGGGWRVVREGRAGAVHYHLLQRCGDDDQGGVSGDV